MKNAPLRIAHVIGSVVKGGVETAVFNYYRVMDRSQLQFDFIIDEDSPYEIPQDILQLGCRVYKTPSYKHLIAYMKALKKIFIHDKYEIVHSHLNTLSVFPLFIAKHVGVPVRIAHNHSTAGKGEFARNIIKYSLCPFSRLYPTHLFACSEHAARWLFGDKAFDEGKVLILKNAINTSKFRFNLSTRKRVRYEIGIANKLVVGHVGRFMPQKNHMFLLDIFAEIHMQNSESVLLLLGDGELKTMIEKKVDRLGLMDCVKFLGVRDNVHELYQAMDVLVLPSLYEGLGIVGVEAQFARLPCVFSSNIPTEAIIGSLPVVLPLDCGAKKWARITLQQAGICDREYRIEENDCSKLWEVSEQVKFLSDFYLQKV